MFPTILDSFLFKPVPDIYSSWGLIEFQDLPIKLLNSPTKASALTPLFVKG